MKPARKVRMGKVRSFGVSARCRCCFGRARLCAVIMGLTGSITLSGCGTGGAPPRPTLGQNVTDGDPQTPTDDPISPAGDDETTPVFTVAVSPVFCCNPLSLNFNGSLSDPGLMGGARFEWDFGDQRAGTGPAVQHTYNWAGNYDVFVTVTLADGRELREYRFLQLRVDDGVSVVEISDPDTSPVQDGTDPANGPETTFNLNAGTDQAVFSGELVTLQGIAAAPPGATVTLAWTQLFGPTVALRHATSLTTTFTAPILTTETVTLAFRLSGTDGTRIIQDELQVTVLASALPPPTRHAPSADDRALSMKQGETTTVRLSGSDADGDNLTFTIVSPPAHGNIGPVDNAPRTFATLAYTPDPDFSGSDSLQYTANDGATESNLAMVTLTVNPTGTDPNAVPDPSTVIFLDGPPERAPAGRYTVSFKFSDAVSPSAVSLRRDCCACQDTLSGTLLPDATGVYTASVDVPAGQTIWYHVFFTHGGVPYMSQSKYVNPGAPQPGAVPPAVIWFHQSRLDPNLLRGVLATGEVSHVMISGGDRGTDANDPNTQLAFQICRQYRAKTIWSRHLWNNFGDFQTLADTVDAKFYAGAIAQILSETTALGADYSAIDGEPYSGTPLDHYLDVDLSQAAFTAMGAAIQAAALQGQVDYVYPAGTHGRPMRVNNLYPPMGRIRIATSTYWDVPHKNCRITFPFDVFGVNIQPTTLRPGAGTNPYFLPHDIIHRRYLWSAADGAENNVNGLFLYPGSQPYEPVEETALLFAQLLGGS